METRDNLKKLISLSRTAGYYTVVDFATKATQAASLLFLANVFSKAEFGSFSILYAVMQFFMALVVGGVVEYATPLLVGDAKNSNKGIEIVLERSFLLITARMICLIPVISLCVLLLDFYVLEKKYYLDLFWLAVCAVAGVVNGVINAHVGILTCYGLHRKSIFYRSKVMIAQNFAGVVIAYTFHEINYYLAALVLMPFLVIDKSLTRLVQGNIYESKRYISDAFSYFFLNSIINWIPWYGLTLAVGIFLSSRAAADYALIMNFLSVMLLAAGGFSQAFISIQIGANGYIPKLMKYRVIVLQTVVLFVCATLLYVTYSVMLKLGVIGYEYGDLHERLMLTLCAVIVSSAYFVTVPIYSLRKRGRTLVFISLCAVASGAISGLICYKVDVFYFPYAAFCAFFVVRAWLVSVKSK